MNSECTLGQVDAKLLRLTASQEITAAREYIAFDVETTGLSPLSNRIIELGAVRFINGEPAGEFSSLVKSVSHVPYSASAVNNITDAMLKSAPGEDEAYGKFCRFAADGLAGDTIFCAHNASFDMKFLAAALQRLGIDASLRFVDTMSLARRRIPGLMNYRQDTVAAHFGFVNRAAHRAATDAHICGQIFFEELRLKDVPRSCVRR